MEASLTSRLNPHVSLDISKSNMIDSLYACVVGTLLASSNASHAAGSTFIAHVRITMPNSRRAPRNVSINETRCDFRTYRARCYACKATVFGLTRTGLLPEYARAQKLISPIGRRVRWVSNIEDKC